MHITNLLINDQAYAGADEDLLAQHISKTQNLDLSYQQNDLTFSFGGLHFTNPEENQYRWILEGYDDHWSEPSKARKARYTNLSPDTYTFRVQASNADGIWNEEGVYIAITIAPPWWQTTWAYLAYVAAIY